MKLLDKLKNAIFEEEEIEETEVKEEKKEVVKPVFEDEIVKKIDIEKTIPKKIEIPKEEVVEKKPVFPKREHRKTPVIFNEEDFIMDEDIVPVKKEVVKKEEVVVKKPLYGGYRDDKPKEKFKPSPIISPVYGFVGVSPILEQPRNDEISSFNEMFAKEKKEVVTLDTVRQKAYGIEPEREEDDDLGLLYDMKQDDAPAISKVTLGDAEEYFDDLGLEYNVDYKDAVKEKKTRNSKSKKKEEETHDLIEEDLNLEEKLESTSELEITKEQMKPRTAKEIKKVKKIMDLDVPEEDDDEIDEKNLYDLIDMMYESKE